VPINLPNSPNTTTATLVDETAIVAIDNDPTIAACKLQANLLSIQNVEIESQWIQVNPNHIHHPCLVIL
jgi:hypothetical protein